jgi:transposase
MWYLGIDVSQATLDAALWGDQGLVATTQVANTADGMADLAAWVTPTVADATLTLVLEPTGGYEAVLADWAVTRGWRVIQVNPANVRDWLRSQGRRAKTDAQDARGLAAYGAAHPHLPVWTPPPAHLSELDDLLKQRDTLDQLLRQGRQRLQQARRKPRPSATVIASHERLLQRLQEERDAVDDAIAEQQQQADDVRDVQAVLEQQPGIGPTISLHLAICFLTWVHDPNRSRNEKALTAFLGLDPQPYESGSSVRKPRRISRMGNGRLRAKLYMAALSQTRSTCESRAHDFYQRLVNRGKPKRVAIVATMRKLLCWAWAAFHAHYCASNPAT